MIRNTKHRIYTIEQKNSGLNSLHDKRCLFDEQINTLPSGYYKVNSRKK